MARSIVVVIAAIAVVGCGGGSLNRSSLRSDAAKQWGCPKSEISEMEESPTVVRVSGCGRSGVYVCTETRNMRAIRHDPMRTKREESRIKAGASCKPALRRAP